MNRKGQMGLAIFAIFIGIIFAFALIPQIFQNQGKITNLETAVNTSFTFPANGTTADLTPCQQLDTSGAVIFNATNGTAGFQNLIVPTSNYTITQGIGASGYPTARIAYNGGGSNFFGGKADNVSCTYEPFGYNHDSSSRNIATIWGIFVALAVAFFVFVGIKFEWFDF